MCCKETTHSLTHLVEKSEYQSCAEAMESVPAVFRFSTICLRGMPARPMTSSTQKMSQTDVTSCVTALKMPT